MRRACARTMASSVYAALPTVRPANSSRSLLGSAPVVAIMSTGVVALASCHSTTQEYRHKVHTGTHPHHQTGRRAQVHTGTHITTKAHAHTTTHRRRRARTPARKDGGMRAHTPHPLTSSTMVCREVGFGVMVCTPSASVTNACMALTRRSGRSVCRHTHPTADTDTARAQR
jgi:hypothetical protein